MWNYRIEPKFEFRSALSDFANPVKGKIFSNETEAKKALAKLPKGFEIVAFMRPSFNPLA